MPVVAGPVCEAGSDDNYSCAPVASNATAQPFTMTKLLAPLASLATLVAIAPPRVAFSDQFDVKGDLKADQVRVTKMLDLALQHAHLSSGFAPTGFDLSHIEELFDKVKELAALNGDTKTLVEASLKHARFKLAAYHLYKKGSPKKALQYFEGVRRNIEEARYALDARSDGLVGDARAERSYLLGEFELYLGRLTDEFVGAREGDSDREAKIAAASADVYETYRDARLFHKETLAVLPINRKSAFKDAEAAFVQALEHLTDNDPALEYKVRAQLAHIYEAQKNDPQLADELYRMAKIVEAAGPKVAGIDLNDKKAAYSELVHSVLGAARLLSETGRSEKAAEMRSLAVQNSKNLWNFHGWDEEANFKHWFAKATSSLLIARELRRQSDPESDFYFKRAANSALEAVLKLHDPRNISAAMYVTRDALFEMWSAKGSDDAAQNEKWLQEIDSMLRKIRDPKLLRAFFMADPRVDMFFRSGLADIIGIREIGQLQDILLRYTRERYSTEMLTNSLRNPASQLYGVLEDLGVSESVRARFVDIAVRSFEPAGVRADRDVKKVRTTRHGAK